MSGFSDRENELFTILETFNNHGLEFIVIGGYAVSAYQHRFSVDADLVITPENLNQFTAILRDKGYEQIEDMEMESSRFVSFQRLSDLPVTVDLMVGSVRSRETDATWSYEELTQNSESVTIEGSERSVTVRIPEANLLMAMKLHSGRLTDARDVVALAGAVDFDQVSDYLNRGDTQQLLLVLERMHDTIRSEDFQDAYKGVFTSQDLPEKQIAVLQGFLKQQINNLTNN